MELNETGTVTEIDRGRATVLVRHKPGPECGGCRACKPTDEGRGMTLRVDADDLEVGDRVTLNVPVAGVWRAMLLVFALPLAALVGGLALGAAWRGLREALGLSAESTGLLVGAVLGTVAFALALVEDRRYRRGHRPRVLEVERPDSS